ncbi:hypothetical protein [Streptomyces sp. NPDC006267]|uniref:hypothetical protein n=1 Tax=Streptomyces sp. NPDC006267 TaxID=3157173 RepID=UPI0033BC607C
MTNFDASDIAAMREQGDLRSFMRGQLRAGRTGKTTPPAPAPKPPGFRPGHWPTGARPPDPRPNRHTDADWHLAIDRYRQGHDSDPCHCGNC